MAKLCTHILLAQPKNIECELRAAFQYDETIYFSVDETIAY